MPSTRDLLCLQRFIDFSLKPWERCGPGYQMNERMLMCDESVNINISLEENDVVSLLTVPHGVEVDLAGREEEARDKSPVCLGAVFSTPCRGEFRGMFMA